MRAGTTTVYLFGFICNAAAFNLYPSISTDKLAKALGISTGCLNALNTTVPCEQTLFEMASMVDSYLWTSDNITELCNTDCIKSTKTWWADVTEKCSSDTLTTYGKLVPAESVAGRYSEGLDLACLNCTPSNKGNSTYKGPWAKKPTAAANESSWCLIESQDWQGSDVIRPDCSSSTGNSTEPQCTDPTNIPPENERIANLYDDDMVRSPILCRIPRA